MTMRSSLVLPLLGSALLGTPAWAQTRDFETEPATAVDASIFKPAMDPMGIFGIESARALRKWDFNVRISTSYAANPLSLQTVGDEDVDNVLDFALGMNFGVAFGLSSRLTVAVDAPILRQSLGDGYGEYGLYQPVDPALSRPGTGMYSVRPSYNVAPSESPVGDVRAGVKYVILTGTLGLAAQAVAWVPFGDEDVFAGSQSFTYEPKLILELGFAKDRGQIMLNAGARLRKGTLVERRQVNADGTVLNDAATGDPVYFPVLYVGHEAMIGGAVRYRLTPRVALAAEAFGLIPVATASEASCPKEGNDGVDCRNGDLTADAMAGAQIQLTPATAMGVAVGAGLGFLTDAARSDDFRLLANLTWTPTADTSRSTLRGDADGDGLADGADLCRDEPEDADGYQDDDGCPELDNDLDGVLDAQDSCAAEPEDRDGHQDDDGCPDTDNDGDKVADLSDRCPLEAEDVDSFQDEDGCPELDNDGDGIVDTKDECPIEAETTNGYLDEDGCPDQGLQGGPRMAQDRIDLQGERVEFEGKTAKLSKRGVETLNGVVAVMQRPEHRGVAIRIEVGVEASGTNPRTKANDRRLSDERARAVQEYLLSKGIDAQRVDAVGLGSERPIDPRNPKDPARNRRVEFIRVTQ